MKRTVIVLLSAAVMAGFAAVASAEVKIGVVDVQRLARDSPQGKAANDALNTEFMPKRKEIDAQSQSLKAREEKLNKDSSTMTEVQKAAAERDIQNGYRDLQFKQDTWQQDLNAARQEAQDRMQHLLNDEVQAFAKANGYDLILMDAAYANASLDVTNSILTSMQARSQAPAAAKPPAAAPATNKVPPAIAKP